MLQPGVTAAQLDAGVDHSAAYAFRSFGVGWSRLRRRLIHESLVSRRRFVDSGSGQFNSRCYFR
jgi:hypothetical protein